MVIDASCIKSLGRAHQLPLSSKKKGCTFVFLHENDSLFPQSVLIFPFCDPGASANGGAVSGSGAAHVLLGGGEGPSVPKVSPHIQIPRAATKTPSSAQKDHGCSLSSLWHVCLLRDLVWKWCYPVRYLGGIYLALM